LNKFNRRFAALIGQAPGRVPTLSPTVIVLPLIEICSKTALDFEFLDFEFEVSPTTNPKSAIQNPKSKCPRQDSNLQPTDYAYQLRLSPPLSSLWSGLSLRFTRFPSSLYAFLKKF
jgi:hypothetical protein